MHNKIIANNFHITGYFAGKSFALKCSILIYARLIYAVVIGILLHKQCLWVHYFSLLCIFHLHFHINNNSSLHITSYTALYVHACADLFWIDLANSHVNPKDS